MVGVNHAFGYDVADEVLTGVGHRIHAMLAEDEAMGRVASSKFGLILDADGPADARRRLLAIRAAIREELIVTGSGPVAVTVSTGAVMLPEQAAPPRTPSPPPRTR